MRKAHAGPERWVVRLMKQGKTQEALAYMRTKGLVANFIGAPQFAPVGQAGVMTRPEPVPAPVPEKPKMYPGNVAPYVYPDFKPVRDPVPEQVKYAKIHRELGHELQKVAILEGGEVQVLVWVGLKEQRDLIARKGRLIGQVLPIEPNPEPLQGGWRIYRR